jgi:hypothetical protein
MGVPKNERIELFVVVKGHAFSRDAFEAMLRAVGCEPTFVDQPAAAVLLNPEQMRRYDAILFYDMPGLDFRMPMDQRPGFVEPDLALKAGFEALLAQGKGIVALHHAVAGWPAWPAYAQALGGLFLYRDAEILGRPRSDSGYVGDRAYTARRAATDHPVLDGIPDRFDLVDELYLFELLDDPTIQPLLYLDSDVPTSAFQSAKRAVRRIAENEGEPWAPSPRNAMLGWAKAAGNSPLVYLQPGDSPATYDDPVYRKLVGNAVRWVTSPGARKWVAIAKQ